MPSPRDLEYQYVIYRVHSGCSATTCRQRSFVFLLRTTALRLLSNRRAVQEGDKDKRFILSVNRVRLIWLENKQRPWP